LIALIINVHTLGRMHAAHHVHEERGNRSRTLIRKTSLLRKIEPIARRSSFANRIIYNSLQPHGISERRNDLEIVMARTILIARSNSDRSPLYDVRKPA